MKRRVLFLLLLGSAITGAWALYPRQSSHSTAASGETAVPAGTAVQLGPYRAGDRHRYELELTTKVQAEAGTLMQYRLTGDWVVDVIAVNAADYRLLARVEHAALGSDMVSDPAQQQRLTQAAADFGTPVLGVYDANGALVSVSEGGRTELQARTMMRAIAAVTQLVRTDAKGGANSWETQESDTVGRYRARYQRVSAREIDKQKLAYVALGGQSQGVPVQGTAADIELTSSRGPFALNGDGLMQRLSYDEVTRITAGLMQGATSTTHYQLRYRGREEAPALAAAERSSLAQKPSDPFSYERPNGYSAEADRARVAGRSFRDMLTELRGLPRSDKDDNEATRRQRRRAFIGLAALFRLDDRAVDSALAAVRAGDDQAAPLWDALASAGTPKAQAALREIIAMRQFDKFQRRAQLIGLSMVPAPTAESVELLRSMTADPVQGQQARFGLGTMVHSLLASDPARADALLAELEQRLADATRPGERSDLVRALGNTAHPGARSTLASMLASDDDRLRADAVWALRQQPGDDVDGLLAKAMQSDGNSEVRVSAVRAAASRKPSDTLVNALLAVIEREPERTVVDGAKHALARYEAAAPEIAQRIASAAQ